MKKYFFSDGNNNFGPFTLDELKSKGITSKTLVWTKEMDRWMMAESVPELSDWFNTPPQQQSYTQNNVPPQLNFNYSNNANQRISRPKTFLTEAILVTLFCCLPFGIAAIVNASKVDSCYNAGDYAGAEKASNSARSWVNWSFGIGLVVFIIYFILTVATIR